jgi:hypothetical protein
MRGTIIYDPEIIVDTLANHFEEHFAEPQYDENNRVHKKCISIYEQLSYMPNIPLDNISINEVRAEWKKFAPKKSTDSVGTSAFLLKMLPDEYLNIITILFNKCTSKGEFFSAAKHAKVVCLSKDGTLPSPEKLRPISLLPNLGKCLERIIHNRILSWCKNMNVYIDEQSGFSPGRRLQTRIISLIEELRLTVAANNRPALAIFVDFKSAFDNMWIPHLLLNLYNLQMPIQLLKWIFNWLRNRSLYICYGDHKSRKIEMKKGAPQGSVIAATLFRLHMHFLTSYFDNITIHLFADDVALILNGSLEKKFSLNVIELEQRAAIVLKQLDNFSKDMILPVNIAKTKAVLIHSIVAPDHPRLWFNSHEIEYVGRFKYLGVYISEKLGWDKYINERLKIITRIHRALRMIFRTINKNETKIRKKLFYAYALPHYIWLFTTWFFFTQNQKERIEHKFCTGLRIVHGLYNWDDLATLVIAREKSIYDYLFTYWRKLVRHLMTSPEALAFQQGWNAYLLLTDVNKCWTRELGFRINSRFFNRLVRQVNHCLIDWSGFDCVHIKQYDCFRISTNMINTFVFKFFMSSSSP